MSQSMNAVASRAPIVKPPGHASQRTTEASQRSG
jgi:hypothetical protein